ncbi:formyl transferase [Altererythrobacter xixiisoli]|uniref:Formyl transferase n=1 Tax=Croceibacterium xixiisoli TaxID=1476466 RepID=A0A6I4TTC2_9SPHN|nr:formyl transferase [Croceibacterium xixiisoli]MXO99122.1 formyl transferase [Croceibacterium xixiisoli]
MELIKDFWRPLIVEASAREIISAGSIEPFRFRWFPDAGDLAYAADPFGIWREGILYAFVEMFDYRHSHGTISVYCFDDRLRLIQHGPVLREDWHLSYPQVFEHAGELWMLPEACASGKLTLYRARSFPWHWEPYAVLDLDGAPIDATPFLHDGVWWLFYTPAGTAEERVSTLCAAYAEDLTGPWAEHPLNPLISDLGGARPGGRPELIDGLLHLPVQDSRGSYGAALRILRIEQLDSVHFNASAGPLLRAPAQATPLIDGCHTFAGAGPVTLIDVKARRFSARALTMRPRREWDRLMRRR